VPLNEFTAAADTLTCEPVPPAWIVTVAGVSDNEKSEVLAAFELELPQDCSRVAAATQAAKPRERMRKKRINISPDKRRSSPAIRWPVHKAHHWTAQLDAGAALNYWLSKNPPRSAPGKSKNFLPG
jgi:hypothetical protein